MPKPPLPEGTFSGKKPPLPDNTFSKGFQTDMTDRRERVGGVKSWLRAGGAAGGSLGAHHRAYHVPRGGLEPALRLNR